MNCKKLMEILKYIHKNNALKYFFRNPSLFFTIYQDTSKFYFSKTLENIFGQNIIWCLHNYLPERFLCHLKEKGFVDHDGVRLLLYTIIRKYKPEIVVETGVALGASSAYILCAMQENGKGHLYSIDLPPYKSHTIIENAEEGIHVLEDGQKHCINDGYMVGGLVPEYLKERWTLISGDAKKELPTLLNKVESVSIFFHDSLHTYEHMMFEYDAAWPHITEGGLLISHDVLWNEAFLHLSRKMNVKTIIYYSLGIIRK